MSDLRPWKYSILIKYVLPNTRVELAETCIFHIWKGAEQQRYKFLTFNIWYRLHRPAFFHKCLSSLINHVQTKLTGRRIHNTVNNWIENLNQIYTLPPKISLEDGGGGGAILELARVLLTSSFSFCNSYLWISWNAFAAAANSSCNLSFCNLNSLWKKTKWGFNKITIFAISLT